MIPLHLRKTDMDSVQLQRTYLDLTTPHVADACIRLGVEVRCAPANTRPLWSGTHLSGRVNPVRHYGSVDVFLEAIDRAAPGDVLVVDNGGRLDEACVGDLITLEASRAGLSGIVIWGLHRDTAELRIIRLPVFSLGALPTGPQRLDPVDTLAFSSATFGEHIVTTDDFVLGDDDGILFIPVSQTGAVAELAISIRDTERHQAARMQLGTTFRKQARFDEYVAARSSDVCVTFRQHLRSIGGAIEE
jgi:regulator of RNase E activity RraA